MSWQWDSGTVSQLFENSVTICDPNAFNSDPGLQFRDHCSKPTETIERDLKVLGKLKSNKHEILNIHFYLILFWMEFRRHLKKCVWRKFANCVDKKRNSQSATNKKIFFMIVVGFLDFSKNQVIRDKGELAK